MKFILIQNKKNRKDFYLRKKKGLERIVFELPIALLLLRYPSIPKLWVQILPNVLAKIVFGSNKKKPGDSP